MPRPGRKPTGSIGGAAYRRAAAVGLILVVAFAVFILSRPVYQNQKMVGPRACGEL